MKIKRQTEIEKLQKISSTQKNPASFIYGKNGKIEMAKTSKKEYETMPKEIKGHKIIGKLQIPSIKLDTYILEETNEETLNLSVTKLTGPEINTAGNFCVTGHNYINSHMFWNLKKVEIGDSVLLTNTFGEDCKYVVYEKRKILPEEIEVLSQETKEEKEITLITCTFGAEKRVVVKAIEEYD